MKDAGIDITVDGVWGPNSRAAWTEFSDPNKKKVQQKKTLSNQTGLTIRRQNKRTKSSKKKTMNAQLRSRQPSSTHAKKLT